MTDGPPPIQSIPADIDAARASVGRVASKLEATIERASALTEDQRKQRVNDEWSTVESLRHLVFVVDIWQLTFHDGFMSRDLDLIER